MPLSITKSQKNAAKAIAKVAPLIPKPYRGGRKSAHNYATLRLDYFRRNLVLDNPKAYSLLEMAEDYKVEYGTLTDHAKKEGWENTLRVLKAEVSAQTERQLIAKAGFNEIQIRSKQARYANLAMDKAIMALQMLDPAELNPKQIISLLQLGLAEERKAYGMVESVTANLSQSTANETVQGAAQRALAIIQQRQEAMRTINAEVRDVTTVDTVDAQ